MLYLLHGNNGKLNDWATLGHIQPTADALIARGEIPPAIIVMPDAGTTWYVDRKEKMETAVIQRSDRRRQRNFRVIDARNGRLIAGLSMGGYGALRFALKYPEMFAAAALLSPAIYDPEPPQASARAAPACSAPASSTRRCGRAATIRRCGTRSWRRRCAVPMYINSGDDDDFFIEAEATRLYSLLRKNGQPAELRIVDGAHRWPVWESTIGDAMRYVFRYSARPAPARN